MVSFCFKESREIVSFCLKSNVSYLKELIVFVSFNSTVSLFNKGTTIFLIGFMSWEKPSFVKKKQQNKSIYDRFVCNALNTIFVGE